MRAPERDSVWVLGDQLDARHPGLLDTAASRPCVLMIESEALLCSRRWHRQRLHLVLTAMRRYAAELRQRGFEVDYRRAASFEAGLTAHRAQWRPRKVLAAEPMSHGMRKRLEGWGVELLRHERFLCHYRDFASWAERQHGLRMDSFYRMRRKATGYLMRAGEPEGGAFSFDTANREPASRAPDNWPAAQCDALDALDHEVLATLPAAAFGAAPDGTWATTRAGALRRLAHFVAVGLPRFGPHQDVMLHDSWHLAHSLLSPYLNLGLLHPREVCDAVQTAYTQGRVPLASAEGFLRQVLGWREYVWGCYWHFGPEYAHVDSLHASRPLLPLYTEPQRTHMQCVQDALASIEQRAYAHHIQRLMVLGNLALLAGVKPRALSDYMQVSFIDGGEWVMWPNVMGMALYADGGRMSTKPYAAGGAYIHRMSNACTRCRYNPKVRLGEDACPFTSLYWAFFARHREQFEDNPRLRNVLQGMGRLRDLNDTIAHADETLRGLSKGEV